MTLPFPASYVWNDYNTPGVSASGAKKPNKDEIRDWGMWLDLLVFPKTTTGTAAQFIVTLEDFTTGDIQVPALDDGLVVSFLAHQSNQHGIAGATQFRIAGVDQLRDVVQIDGGTVTTILPAATIRTGGFYWVRWDNANTRWVLLNPTNLATAAFSTDAVLPVSITRQGNGDLIRFLDYPSTTVGSVSFDGNDLSYNALGGGELKYDASEDKWQVICNNTTPTVYVSTTGLMVGIDALIDPTENTFGCSFSGDGLATFSRQGDVALRVKRGQNDGTLVQFTQGTTVEGIIEVSGNTITYGSFCGGHWSQRADNVKTKLLVGTILESVDELCEWVEEVNDTLPKYKIGTQKCAAAYGVFKAYDEDGDTIVASVGVFKIRMAEGQEPKRGDLVECAGRGLGRVQSDDVVRSSTVAKVVSGTVVAAYPDGSFCVPCSLHCG